MTGLVSGPGANLQETEEDHAQEQQASAAKINAQDESLSKLAAEAADLRSELEESKVENERVMEALRRAGDDKLAQTTASSTLEVSSRMHLIPSCISLYPVSIFMSPLQSA